MKKVFVYVLALLLVVSFSYVTYAASTPEDAKEMVKKAAAFYKKNGKDAAFKEFNIKGGQFTKFNNEIYMSVYDMKGIVVAHGTNPAFIGKDMINLKDPNGVFIVKQFVDKAKAGEKSGWVKYKWTNPASGKMENKECYFEVVDDYIIQAGAYSVK